MAQATQSPQNIRRPDLAEYSDGRLTPEQKALQAQADKDVNEVWNNLFMQAPSQIEYVPQPEAEYQISPQTLESINYDSTQVKAEEIAHLQKIVEVEQKQISHATAEILDALLPKSDSSMGSIDFSLNNELQAPLPFLETSLGLEPKLPIEHKETAPVNLQSETQHHSDVDFKYFFDTTGGWAAEGAKNASIFILKPTLNVKTWGEAKGAIWDNLIWKEVFGFGGKKELTKEEKEKQQTQAANKRSFFAAMRVNMGALISTDQRRALKSRLESINKSLKRGNLSYEGDMDASGQIKESVLIESEKANSQKNEEQLKAEKRSKLMMATPKSKRGPGITTSMDKAHNFNNAAKLAG